MTRCVRRYGSVFTIRFVGLGNLVYLTDPEDVKAVFTGDPDVFRAGEANQMLEPVLGQNSVLLIDGEQHLRRRRVLLPPFHGESIERYRELIGEITAARGRPLAAGAHVRAAAADAGDHARGDPAGRVRDQRGGAVERLRVRCPSSGASTSNLMLAAVHAAAVRALEPRRARFERVRGRDDELLYEEIAFGAARPTSIERDDVLSLLLRPATKRQPHDRHRAARRADDPARRGPRDDGDRTVMGLRAPASRSARAAPAEELAGDDELPRRRGEGVAARAAGRRGRRPQADQAPRDRGLASCRPGRCVVPAIAPCTETRTSTRSRSSSGRSGSSRGARALHLDPVRRRHAALRRRRVRPARDEGRDPDDSAARRGSQPASDQQERSRLHNVTLIPPKGVKVRLVERRPAPGRDFARQEEPTPAAPS